MDKILYGRANEHDRDGTAVIAKNIKYKNKFRIIFEGNYLLMQCGVKLSLLFLTFTVRCLKIAINATSVSSLSRLKNLIGILI